MAEGPTARTKSRGRSLAALAFFLLLAFALRGSPTETPVSAMPSSPSPSSSLLETNRLADSLSPYLRQHAANPVPWRPWGAEARARARELDRPIFLSIGYSTCHWCHVMAHESFENAEVAEALQRSFVSVKVDREERPDVDAVYMAACQLMSGSGGWPLTLVLTPAGEPFFAATYLPREDRQGRMGLLTLLKRIETLWREDRKAVLEGARDLTAAIRKSGEGQGGKGVDAALLEQGYEDLARRFDALHGGFGQRPKFPTPHQLAFLFRYHGTDDGEEGPAMALQTLRAIRKGGIFDHLGLGVHRYATDRAWLLPHFEKMLYDQALVAIACAEGFERTGAADLEALARELLSYALRDLRAPGGAFFAAEDADSEGEEGKFYLWTRKELAELLGPKDGAALAELYGVKEGGNFDPEHGGPRRGENVLNRLRPLAAVTKATGLDEQALDALWQRSRPLLTVARARRVRPGRDEKILLDWNGLMIAALARCGRVFDDGDLVDAAARSEAFLRRELRKDGHWLHRYSRGRAGIPGMLDDHAFLAWGLWELWQAEKRPERLAELRALVDETLQCFWDDRDGGFFFTAAEGEGLIVRSKDAYDGALPSGNAVMVDVLLGLAEATKEERYGERARATAKAFGRSLHRAPAAHSHMLAAFGARMASESPSPAE